MTVASEALEVIGGRRPFALICGDSLDVMRELRLPCSRRVPPRPRRVNPPRRAGRMPDMPTNATAPPRLLTVALYIPSWSPATVNQLVNGHWARRNRLKKSDKEIVAAYARLAGLAPAVGRRRVSLHQIVPPGKRRADPDAAWKSLLDALVAAGLLRDDGPRWCVLGGVTYSRSDAREVWGTLVVLEDI